MTVAGIATEIPENTDELPSDLTFDERDQRAKAWKRCFGQLDSLLVLPPNWDDAGAPAIPEDLVTVSRKFLEAFQRLGREAPSRVVPAPSGTIIAEWQLPDLYVELEISETCADVLIQHPSGEIEQDSFELPKVPSPGIAEDEPKKNAASSLSRDSSSSEDLFAAA